MTKQTTSFSEPSAPAIPQDPGIEHVHLPAFLVASLTRINNDLQSLQQQKIAMLSLYLAAAKMDGNWVLTNNDTMATRVANPCQGPLKTSDPTETPTPKEEKNDPSE